MLTFTISVFIMLNYTTIMYLVYFLYIYMFLFYLYIPLFLLASAGQNKSNKKLIRNALCFVCLAGEANITLKQKALAVSQ